MKLRKLTATFGCLDGATLTFGPGLTLIGAPNGSGKSTWCAFLRVMLYGLDTRQRDRKGAPADKNRYRPWNGKPMEGLLECEHQGAVILLRRTSAGGVPMGDFSAVYQATGLPVPGLTADNAGEVLTGLSREVFDRSVFLRQTALAVTQSQDLEKRITDLVSSGEEDVSWSEANDRLKAWLHRRRFHKSGRIPLLEAEAAQLRQTVAQTAALRQDLAQQQARAATLRRQADHWDKRLSAETDKFQTVSQQRYAQAAAELDADIEKYARGWRFERISLVASAIMRVAMYEILYMADIPQGAAISEAVTIAKKYETPEVAKFINGILGSFARGEVKEKD